MRPMRIVAMALLSGCGAVSSDIRPAVCDWLVVYPRDVQAKAAEELARCDAPIVLRMIDDYGELRARIRAACR